MAAPNPPSIVAIAQASGIVICGIQQATVTGTNPIAQYKLYRAFTAGSSSWTLVDAELLSGTALTTNCYDQDPILGFEIFYAATAVDSSNNESARGTAVPWSAFLSHPPSQPNISAAAYGPYPLLGSDVFLDPRTCEARIGPNGDMLTVNGLECLAQDLRIRILSRMGELPLQPTFGLPNQKIIGAGQGNRTLESQRLYMMMVECLTAEPRVKSILSIQVNQQNFDAWLISYSVMAIGVEDPLKLNHVVPYAL